MTEKEGLIALASFVPFGPARIKLLLSYFGSARQCWKTPVSELLKLGLGKEKIELFEKHRKEFDSRNYNLALRKEGIEVITYTEASYPLALKDIEAAPLVLYVKGSLEGLRASCIAIVGSRKMTSYGREVAHTLSSQLASMGLTIVSGLARGVDTQAHIGALEVGGRTIAILGCGLDQVYPLENTKLAKTIIAKSGAIISEYPIGYPALPINFAARNRIISGLSKAVVVVEGTKNSGTLLTASHAAEQGRTVFAVPGPITSPLSEAPLFLLQNGAKLLTSAKDIFEELDIDFKVSRQEVERTLPETKEEVDLLALLDSEPLHLDELARISSLDIGSVSARLTIMEIKGLVKDLGAGVYKKTG